MGHPAARHRGHDEQHEHKQHRDRRAVRSCGGVAQHVLVECTIPPRASVVGGRRVKLGIVAEAREQSRTVGRYTLYERIASGRMGTVYLGTLNGPAGFRRVVAIKSPHPTMSKDPDLARLLIDE